jgi:hypothetical protein
MTADPTNNLNPAEQAALARITDTLTDTDTGRYQLIMYKFRKQSASDMTDDLKGFGGIDRINGGPGDSYTLDYTLGAAVLAQPEASEFTRTVTIDDRGAVDWTGSTVDYGDGSGLQPLVVSASGSFDLNHTWSDNGNYTVTVTIRDDIGQVLIRQLTVTVVNVSPVVTIQGAPDTSPEGTAISLISTIENATGPVDPLAYAWTVKKNGVVYATGSTADFEFTPDDNGIYVVTLTVTDDDLGSAIDTASISVTNVNPTAAIVGAPLTSAEGTAISLTSAASDVAGANDPLTYAWTVTKNGVEYATASTADFEFTPDDNGIYVVTLTVTDDDLGSAIDTTSISVTNVSPTAAIVGAPLTSAEGTAISLTSAASDVAGVNDPLTYAWKVTKNGVEYATASTADFEFTPDDNGIYVVTLTVTDDDLGSAIDTASITVTNVNPTAAIVGAPLTSAEGTAISLTSAASDVAGVNDPLTYAWTVTKNGVAYAAGSTADFEFTPDDNGIYVVTLTVTDDDLGSAIGTASITVTNVNPTAAIVGAPLTSAEGTAISLTSATSDVAGVNDPLTYAWTVTKNGVAYATGSTADFEFTPDDNGIYVVTLTVTDDDLGSAIDTASITVTNVNPTAAIVGAPLTSAEGTAISLTSAASDVAGANDPLTYAWTVTKNGVEYATASTADFEFTPDDNGIYVVTLTVTDDDLGSAIDTASITVTNVNPTAAIVGAPLTSAEGTAISLTSAASDVAGIHDPLTYAWTVTKNGVAYATASTADFEFTPDDNGTYVVTLTVTDDELGATSDTKTITVTNVAPTVDVTGPTSSATGVPVTVNSVLSDPAGSADPLTLTWTITRDGLPFATQTGGTSLDFTPTQAGTWLITLTADDGDGGITSDSQSVTVIGGNTAPSVAISGPASGVRGQTLTWTLTASDPDAADASGLFTWTINWGDGSPVQAVTGPAVTTVSHVYTSESTARTISVTARDAGGLTGSVATKIVQILVWQIQADPLQPGSQILVVGGSEDGERIRLTRHGSDHNGYYKLRIDQIDSDECDDEEENEYTIRIYSTIAGVIVYAQGGNDRIDLQNKIDIWSVLDGGSGNDRVKGGAAANIILGRDGDDRLYGEKGRDLLIGGRGADRIEGGKEDDLIIAGFTALDDNREALQAILKEWTSHRSFSERRSRILGATPGGLNGSWVLKSDGSGRSVFDDGALDQLWGGDGRDWFLLNLDSAPGTVRDQIKDWRSQDEDDDIDLF